MELELFKNPKRSFVISLFIDQLSLKANMKTLENLGNQRNVKLVVQPCPYEGIEFLYRVSKDLVGHFVSLEKEVFWEAIEHKPGIDKSTIDAIAQHHINYLTAILEQDTNKVKQEVLELKLFEEYLVKPLSGD